MINSQEQEEWDQNQFEAAINNVQTFNESIAFCEKNIERYEKYDFTSPSSNKFLNILTTYLSPQKVSPSVEKAIINTFSCEKLDKSLKCGDFKYKDKTYEFKQTTINEKGMCNFVQLRPHHIMDMYWFYVNDPFNDKQYHFHIPSKWVHENLCKSYAHGFKDDNNQSPEYRISMKYNDKNWILMTQFLVNLS